MNKKIIVAGGGHGGIAAAAQLAKKGFDVTVYEKNGRKNMGADWTDIFDKKGFTGIGIPMPQRSEYNLKNNMTFIPPNLKNTLTQNTPEDQLELQMERKTIYDYIIRFAEDAGVRFEYECEVIAPLILGDRVVGIKTAKGDVYADLVIDAAGIDSPVRTKLPPRFGIQQTPKLYEQFYVYRGFFERTAEIPEDCFRVHLLHNGILGISWVAIEEEHTDILIGRFKPFGMEEVEKELESLRSEQPALGKKLLRGGSFVKIPVRQPLAKLVANGYAAIGDSAFMTVPLIGSGIANSLKASKLLAEVIASDDGSFSERSLYEYQKLFFRKYGAGLAPIACVKLLLTKVTVDDVNYLFDEGVLNSADITMGADSNTIWKFLESMKSPAALIKKVPPLAKNPKLAIKIFGMAKDVVRAVAVSNALPPVYGKKEFELWQKAYNSIF